MFYRNVCLQLRFKSSDTDRIQHAGTYMQNITASSPWVE